MAFWWRCEREGGDPIDPPVAPRPETFPTQSDAETWLGESWRDLLDAGVYQVSLMDGDRVVYAGMGLHAPD